MFLGHYEHSIDDKGRLTIPFRFREMLEGGAYIMMGFDGNLMVMTSSYFDQFAEKINALTITDSSTRLLQMMIFQSADHLEVDRTGRILLPQYLRQTSKLEDTAIITGAGEYFSIWSPATWAKQLELLQDPEVTSQRFAALSYLGLTAMSVNVQGDALPHLPVLYQEIITAIHPKSPGLYIDGTVGAGGHAWGILEASRPDGQLLGLDIDPQALALSRQRLSVYGSRVTLMQVSYSNLDDAMHRMGWDAVQGIILDLGVSSMQLDTPERGFSFKAGGPLDMRFSPDQTITAAQLVNDLPEHDLANLIWQYGEESQSRRIAHAIVQARPLSTTSQLAEVISNASGARRGKIHPATRTFQALRIAVNKELETLSDVLPKAIAALAPEGRLAIISFHSLEDRLVKQFFRWESQDCICPPEQPMCTCGHWASLKIISRHVIQASEEEVETNSRSRSARLRVAEKI